MASGQRVFVWCCLLVGPCIVSGCDGDDERVPDAGGIRDAGSGEAGPIQGSDASGGSDASAGPGGSDVGGSDASGPDASGADASSADAGGSDAGSADAGSSDAGGAGAGGATLYPDDRVLSPMSESVVSAVTRIASANPARSDDVFLKAGTSTSSSANYLRCFADSDVDLASYAALDATLAKLKAGDAGGTDPFSRVSLAVTVGWSAGAAIDGDPSPVELEMDATGARFGLVNFGLSDNLSSDASLETFANDTRTLLDRLIDHGVIPIVLGTQARADSADADAWVETFNAVLRGVAQARQVPFVDLHRALASVTGEGLGPDGVHLDADPGGACTLTASALDHGYNVLNLSVLQTLDRVVAALASAAAPDAADSLAGTGTSADPFAIPWLPFSHEADTTTARQSDYDTYSGCSALQDESGPEYVYELVLDRATALRIIVLSEDGADLDVHLLDDTASVAGCLSRSNRTIAGTLAAGTYHLAVDTYASSGVPEPGAYLLIVQPCEAADATCAASIP